MQLLIKQIEKKLILGTIVFNGQCTKASNDLGNIMDVTYLI